MPTTILKSNPSASKYSGLLASFYDADHSWRDYSKQTGLLNQVYRDKKQRAQVRILDCCCGTGSHTISAANSGYNVTGFDRSSDLLEIAKKKPGAQGSQVRFDEADIFNLSVNKRWVQKFDAAMLFGWTVCMKPIHSKFDRMIQEIHRVLKDGGLFFLDVPVNQNLHRIESKPLTYSLSKGLRGTLRIKNRTSPHETTYFYHWNIEKKGPANRIEKLNFKAEETCVCLNPEDLLNRLNQYSSLFRIAAALGDYSLSRPYRKGDKNLVLILQKNVHDH